MFELDDLAGSGSLEKGFILKKELFKGDLTTVRNDSILTFKDVSLSLDDIIIYLMNGLYGLKEGHSVVFIVLFGTVFMVSLRKYAEPDENDIMQVYEMLKMSLLRICNNEAVNSEFAIILSKIKSGRLSYVK